MRAVTWQGKEKMEVRNVSDPTIIEPTDAIELQQQRSAALIFICIITVVQY